MTIFQILAWPGTAPTIILATIALHYAMFSSRSCDAVKWMFILTASILPSLIVLILRSIFPVGPPHENLMPGLGEALLLAICIPVTMLSAVAWLIGHAVCDRQHRPRDEHLPQGVQSTTRTPASGILLQTSLGEGRKDPT